LVGPLGLDQDGAVVLVADPAEDAELVRPLDRLPPEADALDCAADRDRTPLPFAFALPGMRTFYPKPATRREAPGSTRSEARRRWPRRPWRSRRLRVARVPGPGR